MLLQYPSVGVFLLSFNSMNTASVTCTTVLQPRLDEKGCTRQVYLYFGRLLMHWPLAMIFPYHGTPPPPPHPHPFLPPSGRFTQA